MPALRDVTVRAGAATLLQGVSVAFAPGRLTAILGPNGAGKSTLLRTAAGLRRADAGTVTLDGTDVRALDARTLARRRAVLAQERTLAFPLPVHEVVLLGRHPWMTHAPTARDRAIVRDALARVGAGHLHDRDATTLSGGERQRVHLARVLAQLERDEAHAAGPRWLLLDEPTTSLDLRASLDLGALLRTLVADGVSVVAVLHDLALATDVADAFVLLRDGRVTGVAASADALPAPLVSETFGVVAERVATPGAAPVWRIRARSD